jgi:O-antigen/teichoic acid export membrane protein
MGISGLLNSTIGIISNVTNFGLGTSAVKDISSANASNNLECVDKTIHVFRSLVWFTGLLGLVITLSCSSLLSRITFDSFEYTIAFSCLAVTLLLNQLSAGQKVLLQGLRKIQHLARANIIGAFAGLLISIPLYYYFRIDGIVPSLILTSIAGLFISWYYAQKIPVTKITFPFRKIFNEGKGMLKMGFMINLSNLIATGSSYIVRVFISRSGGVDDVGLYTAGFAIVSTYVGLVFSAMATDYYPRLSSAASDDEKSTILINQQAEIALLILGPILSIFIIFINWILLLLYSSKFLAVDGMIHYAALGIYFKAVTWAMGFILLAKGDSKVFFWSELFTNSYFLLFNIVGYHFLKFDGLGLSFLISNGIAFVQIYLIVKIKYRFFFSKSIFNVFAVQLLMGALCFLCTKYLNSPIHYFFGIAIIIFLIIYSISELNKRVNLKYILKSYKIKAPK